MWDSSASPLLCLLPSLFLFLTAVLLQWSPVRVLVGCVATWATRVLWKGTYWVLELPTAAHNEGMASATLCSDNQPVSGPPLRLVCKPTALAHHLRLNCPTLMRPSLATAWPWADPHLQTLSSLLWPAEDASSSSGQVHFNREHLLLTDGGLVALDWAVGLKDESLVWAKHEQQHHPHHGSCRNPSCRSNSYSGSLPILLVVPNCLGVVTPHLQQLCSLALHWGFWPVVFQRRGQGGCPLTTPRYQEFGDPRDLAQTVAYVHRRHPNAMLLAVSEGSGSGLLLSYLGEYGSASNLTAAACISPVLQGQLWFETPLPSLYHWGALYHRKLQISRYASALSSVMDVGQLLRCRTVRDVEELMFCGGGTTTTTKPPATTPTMGDNKVTHSHPDVVRSQAESGQDWEAYWEHNEPLRDADEVAVPILCLCSADDPLVPPPPSALLNSLFRNSPYFLLALTTHGGHCGFAWAGGKGNGGGSNRSTRTNTSTGSNTSTSSWSHQAVLEYFQVVGDFLRREESNGGMGKRWGGGQEADGVGAVPGSGGPGPQGARQRSGTLLARRRRAMQAVHRKRHQSYQQSQSELPEEELFTWNRSYTR